MRSVLLAVLLSAVAEGEPAKPVAPPGVSEETARAALAAIRAAGLDPAKEITTKGVSKPKLSSKAAAALKAAGFKETADVAESLKRFPAALAAPPPPAVPPPAGPAGPPGDGPAAVASKDACAPIEGVGGPDLVWTPEGFGGPATGGAGGKRIEVTQATSEAVLAACEQASAAKGNAEIVFACSGDIDLNPKRIPLVKGDNVTVDGRGRVTIWGDRMSNRNNPLLSLCGTNVVVRNLRVRNGGDNLSFGGASYPGSTRVLISHVSSTGSGDDGVSIAYGSKDATLQWSFVGGCTRSIFLKYENKAGDKRPVQNISLHHNYITRQWIRGPLAVDVKVLDFRNNIVTNWREWGSRFDHGTTGNGVNNLHILDPWCHGKPDSTVYHKSDGPVYFAGNVGRNCKSGNEGTTKDPVPAASVTTLPVEEMEKLVGEYAGCLPRDAADREVMTVPQMAPAGKVPQGLRTPLTTREGAPAPAPAPSAPEPAEPEDDS